VLRMFVFFFVVRNSKPAKFLSEVSKAVFSKVQNLYVIKKFE
jgi:hypothetical protein